MKKCTILLILLMLSCADGCTRSAVQETIETSTTEGETDMNVANRTMIAEALDIAEDSRNIRFILNAIEKVGAGQLQSAEANEVDGEKVLDFIAEDQTNYRMYLSQGGSVEAVKNMDTGEWPIQSER